MQSKRMRMTHSALQAVFVSTAVFGVTTSVVSADQVSPAATPLNQNTSTVQTDAKNTTATSQNTASSPAQNGPDRRVSRGVYLARTALSYRGIAYRWGGKSPRTGFDCSGLVQMVCAKWGLYLPRVARAQYKVGVPVPKDKLEPGDLVFFKNTYRHGLSHVGIYIGDNFFIHAAGVGKGVCIGRLDQGYHKKHWAGARRLNLSKLPPVPGEETTVTRVMLEPTSDSDTPAAVVDGEAAH